MESEQRAIIFDNVNNFRLKDLEASNQVDVKPILIKGQETDSLYLENYDINNIEFGVGVTKDITVGTEIVDDDSEYMNNKIPNKTTLIQNYPNPFNPETNIEYTLSSEQNVKINVYNSIGQHIKTLINKTQSPGKYQLNFNGDNLPSGVYLYQMESESKIKTKKMILAK